MATLEEILHGSIEPSPHPRLRNWSDRLKRGATATVEVSGTKSALGQSQPELHVQFTEHGQSLPLESILWDADLNAGLIQLGVRAINAEQEAERFALALRAAMSKPVREFGDGYFNSVLVSWLEENDLTRYPEIAEVLKFAPVNPPSRDGRGRVKYDHCRDLIAHAISGRSKELTGALSYPQAEAVQILTAALARYLDMRFTVSSRRQLGLL